MRRHSSACLPAPSGRRDFLADSFIEQVAPPSVSFSSTEPAAPAAAAAAAAAPAALGHRREATRHWLQRRRRRRRRRRGRPLPAACLLVVPVSSRRAGRGEPAHQRLRKGGAGGREIPTILQRPPGAAGPGPPASWQVVGGLLLGSRRAPASVPIAPGALAGRKTVPLCPPAPILRPRVGRGAWGHSPAPHARAPRQNLRPAPRAPVRPRPPPLPTSL
jgi:hypothetical protein